jgi:hypothetical protein
MIPMLASQASINGAGEGHGAAAVTLRVSCSIRTNRRFSVAFIFRPLANGIDDFEWNAAHGCRIPAVKKLIELASPVVEPSFGIRRKPADIRRSRFQFFDPT